MNDQTPPPPIGRRARNRASRAAFTEARRHGLIARKAAKLQHLRERAAEEEQPRD